MRFYLKEAPVAARQKLHLIKQNEGDGLAEYLQRILTSAMDGCNTADSNTVQQFATEAFLRGVNIKRPQPMFLISRQEPYKRHAKT